MATLTPAAVVSVADRIIASGKAVTVAQHAAFVAYGARSKYAFGAIAAAYRRNGAEGFKSATQALTVLGDAAGLSQSRMSQLGTSYLYVVDAGIADVTPALFDMSAKIYPMGKEYRDTLAGEVKRIAALAEGDRAGAFVDVFNRLTDLKAAERAKDKDKAKAAESEAETLSDDVVNGTPSTKIAQSAGAAKAQWLTDLRDLSARVSGDLRFALTGAEADAVSAILAEMAVALGVVATAA